MAFNKDHPRRAKGLRQHVKRLLQSWENDRTTRIFWQALTSISALKWSLKNKRGLYTSLNSYNSKLIKHNEGQYSLPIMRNSQLSSFRRFKSGPEHLEIRDKDAYLLAYRLRILYFLVEGLVETDTLLPEIDVHQQRKIDPRGEFPIRHYATWADSSLDIFYSKDYLTQQLGYITWIEKNKSLWRYLGDRLKLIFPEAYNKLTHIKLPDPLQLLCYP